MAGHFLKTLAVVMGTTASVEGI
ncbi:uncharacterized protein METZ01_LOCUS104332 [marine metagenome]|uniref:Uncharacterized protein n=1 Tax=marine metagenome TaxID=408172 RepID=A0A381WHA4_9ZZZZ